MQHCPRLDHKLNHKALAAQTDGSRHTKDKLDKQGIKQAHVPHARKTQAAVEHNQSRLSSNNSLRGTAAVPEACPALKRPKSGKTEAVRLKNE